MDLTALTGSQILTGALILAAIIAFIYAWSRLLDDSQKSAVIALAKDWAVPIILICLYFYFRDKWGIVADSWVGEYKYATFLLVEIFLLYGLGRLFLARQRYVSTHAVADNRSGSCAKYQEIGDHVVLNIGSCDANAFPWAFGHETWVVPKNYFKKVSGIENAPCQIFTKTFLLPADMLDLPPLTRDFVETNSEGYHKTNIFYGEFTQEELSEKFLSDGKQVSKRDVFTQLKDTQRALNEQRDMTRGRNAALKQHFSEQSSIMKKMRGDSVIVPIGQGGGEQQP